MRQFPKNTIDTLHNSHNSITECATSNHLKPHIYSLSLLIFTIFVILSNVSFVNANCFVIVKSQGAVKYRQGDQLLADSPINLSADAKLTLLTAKGEKILIAGPLRGSLKETLPPENHAILKELSREEQSMIENMAEILSDYRKNSMPLRGHPSPPEPEDTWQISTVIDGDQCSRHGHRPLLWRPNIDNQENMSISAETLGDETSVIFNQGAEVHPWPIDLSLIDNGIYRVKTDKKNDAKQITLHLLPDNLPTRAHLASALAKKKCSRQAAQLLIEAEIDKLLGQLITKGKF